MQASPASFMPVPASVGAARRYAASVLQASTVRYLQDDVRTVVSELATNAVLHAWTPVTITVLVDVAGVRVASPTPRRADRALPREGDLSGTTGRGLRIVAPLSTKWGVEVHDDGKTTWCLLPAVPSSVPTGRPRDDTAASTPTSTVEPPSTVVSPRPDGQDGRAKLSAGLTALAHAPAPAVAA